MPEKLLTLEEASQLLGIPKSTIQELVEKGELPAYKVGGSFLRFRKEQIEAIKNELVVKKITATQVKISRTEPKRYKQHQPHSQLFIDTLLDFFYFNDFYIIAGVLALLIAWFIFKQ